MAKTEIGFNVTGLNDLKTLNKTLDSIKGGLRGYAQEATKTGRASKPLVAIYSEQAAKLQKLGVAKKQSFAIAKQMYAEEVKLAKSMKTTSAALDQQEKDWRQLERSINPAKAASVDFARKLEILNRQFKDKSSAEYTKNLKLLIAQGNRAGVSFNKTTGAFTQGSKSMARSGLAMQQAGYQVQDFIVQVQSGTNPLIAFAQQGSQLAGFFAGPWGAMIGVGIAAVSALTMALMAAGGQAKTFDEAMGDATSALDDYKSALDQVRSRDLDETFGSQADSARDLADALAVVNRELASANLMDVSKALTKGLDSQYGFWEYQWLGLRQIGSLYGALPYFDLPTKQRDIQSAIDKMGFNGAIDSKFFDQYNANMESGNFAAAAAQLEPIISGIKDNTIQLNTEGLTLVKNLSEAAQVALDFKANLDGSANVAKINKELDDLSTALLPFEQAFNSILDTENHWELLMGKTKDEIKAAQEEASFMAEVIRTLGDTATPELVDSYREFYQYAVKAREETERLADAIDDAVAASQALSDFGDSIQFALVKAQAEYDAIKNKQDGATASFIAGEKLKLQAAYDVAIALSKQTDNSIMAAEAALTFSEGMANLAALEALRNKIASSRAGRGGGSRGKSEAEKMREELDKLYDRNEVLRETFTLTGDQLAIEEQLYGLRQKYGALFTPQLDAATRAILEQNKALEKQKQIMEGLADTIANSIGNAFSDVITGASTVEEALKKMALNIINELFRVLVVEQMVASIKSSLMVSSGFGSFAGGFFANGAAFQNGRVVPFADGGVVSSPTYFPMAGNQTGLMGEAGPEAIMPLQRSSDGKLGVVANSNSEPVVNQKIINVLDPSIVGDFLSSRQGEKVIMNVMRRNGVV